MTATNPAPDNDTMESLIDTNEQLQQALNLHQRSVLNARKHVGIGARNENDSPTSVPNGRDRSLSTTPDVGGKGKGKGRDPDLMLSLPGGSASAGPSRSGNATPSSEDDPFRDPPAEGSNGGGSHSGGKELPRMGYEPFHPGGFDRDTAGLSSTAAGKMPAADPVSPITDSPAFERNGGRAGFGRRNSDDDDDRDDIYNATPQKDAAYRY